jgi:hypothetical protein
VRVGWLGLGLWLWLGLEVGSGVVEICTFLRSEEGFFSSEGGVFFPEVGGGFLLRLFFLGLFLLWERTFIDGGRGQGLSCFKRFRFSVWARVRARVCFGFMVGFRVRFRGWFRASFRVRVRCGHWIGRDRVPARFRASVRACKH